MELNKFKVDYRENVRVALAMIEDNHLGIIFVHNDAQQIIAIATDGDIRRHLLSGGNLDDAITTCANTNFVWESSSTSREILLKKLDSQIRVIPLLDANKRLLELVSKDNLPAQTEGAVYARSRAPVRVSFGGGGSDLTHYFSNSETGAVINTTVSLYCHATLYPRLDSKINIHSMDLGDTLSAEDLSSALQVEGNFGLIQAVLKVIKPNWGFDLFLRSDFPMKSGLGGSAAVSAAVLGCFNQLRRDQWDRHELAELAYQAERHHLKIAGGWQDQYATVFGGFNFMEFRMDQNVVHPLRIPTDTLLELEESLLLCDTGIKHDSGSIHADQRQNMAAHEVKKNIEENVKLSYAMRNDLLRGRLTRFGEAMHDAWMLKREFSAKISSSHLDQVYQHAIASGATGGKLLGAGGGGFFLFFVSPRRKHNLITELTAAGLNIQPFRFESCGLQSWTIRDEHLLGEGVNYGD